TATLYNIVVQLLLTGRMPVLPDQRYFPLAMGIRHPVPKARSLLMFVYPRIWVGLWKISGERSLWYFSR
ncbi:hypothetical protein, partial [Lyngbya sp. CCY1209]|uniref:hypothetical protein n=1 Tax=Lyngbya sp. CCY1209 TaxID=2886103 RepID=UPI002D207BD4